MKPVAMSEGSGRTKVTFAVQSMGSDLVVRLYNAQGHIGAVALAEYHPGEKRASTSVLTRFGHKDDSVAYTAAYRICSRFKKPVCALAGIHLDDITGEEIRQIVKNCNTLVDRFLGMQGKEDRPEK